ncbi:recombinase family protein, partial [Pseudarthrobacter sp. MDT3-1]
KPPKPVRNFPSANGCTGSYSTRRLPLGTRSGVLGILAMVAEFEADLIRARTREGMAVAKAKGRLRRKQPKLSKTQEAHLVSVHRAGTHTTVEIAELFAVARSTVYRAIKRAGDATV